MLEIIHNKEDWDSFLKTISNYDFYHTYDYHSIAKTKKEIQILIKYKKGDIEIGLPLIIRNIPNSDYKDATSVYGYSGPISKGIKNHYDNSDFIKELMNWFKTQKIISVFSRLNPFIPKQHNLLLNCGEIIPKGDTVYFDLTTDMDLLRQNYQRRLKTHLNKSRRHCTVKVAESEKDLKKFIEIYHENMDRVNADKSYYFSNTYYKKIANSPDFKSEILLAVHNESKEIIAGSLFITSNSIVHYYHQVHLLN